MPGRRIERGDRFIRDLRLLTRRHRDLPNTVATFLDRYSTEGPSARYRQPGVDGLPVFKERLPLQGIGRRGGARIIAYCDDERVLALRLYTKSDVEILPVGEIRDALKDAGLLEPALPEGEPPA